MTRIAVFSDSHGNLPLLREAVASALRLGCDRLVHLGDNYRDMGGISHPGIPLLRVPGLQCPERSNPFVSVQAREQIEQFELYAIHDAGELQVQERKAALILFGHTHQYALYRDLDRIWCNPGHLKSAWNRGSPASFAWLVCSPGQVAGQVLSPAGQVYLEENFHLP